MTNHTNTNNLVIPDDEKDEIQKILWFGQTMMNSLMKTTKKENTQRSLKDNTSSIEDNVVLPENNFENSNNDCLDEFFQEISSLVEIKESTIPNAGRGVFASSSNENDIPIGEYTRLDIYILNHILAGLIYTIHTPLTPQFVCSINDL